MSIQRGRFGRQEGAIAAAIAWRAFYEDNGNVLIHELHADCRCDACRAKRDRKGIGRRSFLGAIAGAVAGAAFVRELKAARSIGHPQPDWLLFPPYGLAFHKNAFTLVSEPLTLQQAALVWANDIDRQCAALFEATVEIGETISVR